MQTHAEETWETTAGGGVSISGPCNMALVRLITLRSALSLFCETGMRPNRFTHPLKIAKAELGYKGNKFKVLAQLDAYIKDVQSGVKPIKGHDGKMYKYVAADDASAPKPKTMRRKATT